LMEAVQEGKPRDTRRHEWQPLERAIALAKHKETKDLLRLAEKLRLEEK
jgi:hypothetical protein